MSWLMLALRALYPMLASRFLTSSKMGAPASAVAHLDTLRTRTAVAGDICAVQGQRGELIESMHRDSMSGSLPTSRQTQ